jgi:hypothetical protein
MQVLRQRELRDLPTVVGRLPYSPLDLGHDRARLSAKRLFVRSQHPVEAGLTRQAPQRHQANDTENMVVPSPVGQTHVDGKAFFAGFQINGVIHGNTLLRFLDEAKFL